jgi:hypothetical protein
MKPVTGVTRGEFRAGLRHAQLTREGWESQFSTGPIWDPRVGVNSDAELIAKLEAGRKRLSESVLTVSRPGT